MKDDRAYLLHVPNAIDRVLNYAGEGKTAFFAGHKTQDAVLSLEFSLPMGDPFVLATARPFGAKFNYERQRLSGSTGGTGPMNKSLADNRGFQCL